MLLSFLTSTDVTSWNLRYLLKQHWQFVGFWTNLNPSNFIFVLLFFVLSLHNLFSSSTATESCYSGLYAAKGWNGRWDCSIFNVLGEKNARACRAHVWSVKTSPQKCGRLVPQEWESHRQNSSKTRASGARKLTILLRIYEALNLIFCKSRDFAQEAGWDSEE